MIQDFFPGEEEGGLRIDKYLSQAAEGLSRSYIQKLLKEGRVLADGRPVKASFQVEEDMCRRRCSRILSRSPWTWIFSMRMRM